MTRKPTQKPPLSLTPAPEPLPPAPTVDSPPPATPTLKLRDLVERVAEATGGRKNGVKDIVEATLAQIAASLTRGEALNLPGLGKVRVARSADHDGRTMMTLKLRSPGAAKPKQALAEAEEDV